MELFRQRCQESGLKVTPQRSAVFRALAESNQHPSAESVYKTVKAEMPCISFDTVNRTLNTLSEIGAAFIVEGSGDVKRFDANLENHQHFKCVKCKRIIDFHDERLDNITLPEKLMGDFTVLRKCVYVEGICDLCKENN